MKFVPLFTAALLSVASASQQVDGPSGNESVFGGMRLLPGYTCTPPQPIDGYWTISKKDGVTIRYQGGNVANVVHDIVEDARRAGSISWTKVQIVEGGTAKVAATKDGHLLINIAPFNFDAKVDSVEQATDVLLMVLTYGSVPPRK